MKRERPLRIFLLFLWEKAGVLLLYAVTAGLFLAIGGLSHMDMATLQYAFSLSGLVVILSGIVSFSRYYRRHKTLQSCLNTLDGLQEKLPPAQTLRDKDYQALLAAQGEARFSEKNAQAIRLREQEDYYTLWVHQIKTPISALRLLLQDGGTPDLGQMEAELFKIGQYADMALQYLRLESLHADLELRRMDVYELVKKAVRKYSVLFIHKKIALEMEPFSAQVLTDEKWFSLILEQIISNAVKYTEKGSVTIYLYDQQTLAIRDSGVGIRKEDLPRVFERGFTGLNGRLDSRATGIGLYLCREVATRLGHSLHIQSQVGQGTTVLIGIAENELRIF